MRPTTVIAHRNIDNIGKFTPQVSNKISFGNQQRMNISITNSSTNN